MDETKAIASDCSPDALKAILATLLHEWQQATLASEAYRWVTQDDAAVQMRVTSILESRRFADRLPKTYALRQQIIHEVISGRHADAATSFRILAGLLDHTPECIQQTFPTRPTQLRAPTRLAPKSSSCDDRYA